MNIYTADALSVLFAYGVFMLVYVANILFSLYLNIEVFNEVFNRYKLGQSLKKAAVLIIATLMLVIAIDTMLLFFGQYVPELSEELQTTITVATVLLTIGRAALKYLVEAYDTFRSILEAKPSVDNVEGGGDE